MKIDKDMHIDMKIDMDICIYICDKLRFPNIDMDIDIYRYRYRYRYKYSYKYRYRYRHVINRYLSPNKVRVEALSSSRPAWEGSRT